MFTEKSFEVFDIQGLEPRMVAIRSEIQPIFGEIGEQLRLRISQEFTHQDFYLHIAQHRRRTAYAPESTWAAISRQKRGYKMEPHFQLGIWRDYVFIYLSIIDQPKGQLDYAHKLAELTDFPHDFVLSKDHTQADYYPLEKATEFIERLAKVKKAELEVGQVWHRERFVSGNATEMMQEMLESLERLLPIYKKLIA